MDKKFIASFRKDSRLEFSVLFENQSKLVGALSSSTERGYELISVFPISSDILEDIKESML